MRMLSLLLGFALHLNAGWTVGGDAPEGRVLVDDFESDADGDYPSNWHFFTSHNRQFQPLDTYMNEREKFYTVTEHGNTFLRAYTAGEAQRISLPASELEWQLSNHPVLTWDWRALRLPTGANENNLNDAGGAIYVTFSKTDWLGRPLSIKYTYSSTLPEGSVVSTGNVKILVASSGMQGSGRWIHVKRNVVKDYEKLFGNPPPDEPFSITLWSDSDDTKSVAEVDFDNIALLR